MVEMNGGLCTLPLTPCLILRYGNQDGQLPRLLAALSDFGRGWVI